jgi:ketopantoate hydroxymethyltransferase
MAVSLSIPPITMHSCVAIAVCCHCGLDPQSQSVYGLIMPTDGHFKVQIADQVRNDGLWDTCLRQIGLTWIRNDDLDA